MRRFGLIGKTLSYSFSKKYFASKFQKEGIDDAKYDLFELANIRQFPELLKSTKELKGLNITIPYKKEVMSYLDRLDASAQKVGAVNVIKIHSNGTLVGFNSDYYGFRCSVEKWISGHPNALILGTGGAADAVKAVLSDINIPYKMVSRTPLMGGYTYNELKHRPEIIADHHLIINTTPLGTAPRTTEKADLPYSVLCADHHLYDLVYNPKISAFMDEGITAGAKVKNGLEMLELQAEKSWEIWNQKN